MAVAAIKIMHSEAVRGASEEAARELTAFELLRDRLQSKLQSKEPATAPHSERKSGRESIAATSHRK